MYKLLDILNELKLVPYKKIKAFQNPSGAIYLLFNDDPDVYHNNTLKKYSCRIGWLDKKTNQIEFESSFQNTNDFLSKLKYLRIPFKIIDKDHHVIGIDYNLFNIKKIDKYSLYDEDVEKENWFNYVELSEIKLIGNITKEKLFKFIGKNDSIEFRKILSKYWKINKNSSPFKQLPYFFNIEEILNSLSQQQLNQLYIELLSSLNKIDEIKLISKITPETIANLILNKIKEYKWSQRKGVPIIRRYSSDVTSDFTDPEKYKYISQKDLIELYNELINAFK